MVSLAYFTRFLRAEMIQRTLLTVSLMFILILCITGYALSSSSLCKDSQCTALALYSPADGICKATGNGGIEPPYGSHWQHFAHDYVTSHQAQQWPTCELPVTYYCEQNKPASKMEVLRFTLEVLRGDGSLSELIHWPAFISLLTTTLMHLFTFYRERRYKRTVLARLGELRDKVADSTQSTSVKSDSCCPTCGSKRDVT